MTDEKRPTHHTESGFENRYPLPETGKRSFWRFLKRRYFGSENWPKAKHQHGKIPSEAPDMNAIHNPDPVRLQVTWIGHATALVQYGGLNILTDPVFAKRASPFRYVGPKRYSQPGLRIDQLPDLDLVLLSHNHYDHFDIESLGKIGNGPRYILPLKNGTLLEKAGISPDQYEELDWDQSLSHGDLKITHVPSNHWSARTTKDRKEMLWGGYILEFADGYRFYFVGDTGWNERLFAEMGERYGGIDFGLIPIGAYEPSDFMRHAHTNPEEAVQIMQVMGVKQALAIHWGTFVLTAEPVDEPPLRLASARKDASIADDDFIAAPVGATRFFPGKISHPINADNETEAAR
ncbi:MBL fold metallo-hydrolase [Thalassospira sp. MCCC 1A03138]|uniref:MBL fold metallo-hydrolase n=1 Tax=Thalassospira sp. MCCC 1A03138 TaxID=1470576 RepID=UPI000A1E8C9B|nr:MBL fold metallo-hydrolase [Thalassospira sp. MCCC 1A03138]